MRFVTYRLKDEDASNLGILREDDLVDLNSLKLSKVYIDMNDLIKSVSEEDITIIDKFYRTKENLNAKIFTMNEVLILSPINKTVHDIICVGLNYQEHIDETKKMYIKDLKLTPNSVYFSKRANTIRSSGDSIAMHSDLDICFDYENELAIIIGKEGSNIEEEEAMKYVFGYTILNDFSARTLQKNHGQWFKGKSLDGYTSMGPTVVHSSQIKFPLELDMYTRVNGEIRQKSNTRYMIKDIPKLIAEISHGMTLVPGDVIATGTPVGVGMGFDPPKYLKPGDIIECGIEEIGVLQNKII